MLKNLRFLVRITQTRLGMAALGEMIHGMFLAAPTGILLIIIWELFKIKPDSQKIWMLTLLLTGMFFLQLWIAGKVMVNTQNTILTMTKKLRLMLGDHLHRLSLGFYKKRDPGDLAAVVLQDVSNFEAIFKDQFPNLIGSVLGTFFLSIFLLMLDWKLTLLMLAAIPCAFITMVAASKMGRNFSEKHIAARNETGGRFLEYVQGIAHLKAFNLTGKRFHTLQTAFENLRRDSIRLEAIIGPLAITSLCVFELFFLLMVATAMTRIWPDAATSLAAPLATSVTVPAFIAFLIVGYRLYAPLQMVMASYAMLNYMNVSVERIRKLLEAPFQDAGKKLQPEHFDIVFDQVSFGYIKKEVLHQINLTIPEKRLTALVGASGSGKTTITNLIARFWDVDQGRITIGGMDVKDMEPRTVYSLISQVFQDVYLFDDTIFNNIGIGNPKATEQEIVEAAKKAQVMEFLDQLEHGIHTKVGEGGSKLSGGQKQRISIARALLKDAPIVLLDEATAALDPENEIYIQQAIAELVKEKTVVVIAHKLQTIRHADQIVVIEKGIVGETGTHDQLIEKKGMYADYWQIQQTNCGWKIGNIHRNFNCKEVRSEEENR